MHAEFGAVDVLRIVKDRSEDPYGNRRTRWLSSERVPRAERLAASLDPFSHYLQLENDNGQQERS